MNSHSRWANTLLLLLAVGLPLAAADLVLRALQLPKGSDRVLLLAGSTLSSGPEGYRRYLPHRQIEHTAVYGDQLAYRTHLTSNNLGLISSPDVASSASIDLAIVGDSFSEGIGGEAWIPAWQRSWLRPHGMLSINYAIGGAGFGDFAVAARAARTKHHAKKVLVLFIEHDAYRPYQPMASQPGCSFYSNGLLDQLVGPLACNLYGVVWHHVPAGQSDQQRIAAGMARQQYGLIPALNRLFAQLGRGRIAAKRVGPELHTTNSKGAQPSLRFGAIPAASISAMKAIKDLYGPQRILLIQLPDQPWPWSALQQQQKSLFRTQLSQAIGMTIIDLGDVCPLKPSDFHKLDNHPNQLGYRRLGRCLSANRQLREFLLLP